MTRVFCEPEVNGGKRNEYDKRDRTQKKRWVVERNGEEVLVEFSIEKVLGKNLRGLVCSREE